MKNLELMRKDLVFEKIYKDFFPEVLRNVYATYANRDMDLAQDYCQLGFIKVYQNLSSFESENLKSLKCWIRQVVKNTIIDEIRKNKKKEDRDKNFNFNNIEVLEDEYDDLFMGKYTEKDIQDSISSLPERQQKVFRLYYFSNLQHIQISDKLGITEGTSKSQLFKAKATVKKFLENLKDEV
jgi:RNA polymerase sigma-70 factor (ECF subfamily)